MPYILQHPPTEFVLEIGGDEPASVMLIIRPRTLKYLLFRDGELGATADGHFSGYRHVRKQFWDGIHQVNLFRTVVTGIDTRNERFLTAYEPGTSKVNVAFGGNVIELEIAQDWDGIKIRIIIMPLISLAMDEDHYVWQIIVIVENISGEYDQARYWQQPSSPPTSNTPSTPSPCCQEL